MEVRNWTLNFPYDALHTEDAVVCLWLEEQVHDTD
jgi:hypothetical protein